MSQRLQAVPRGVPARRTPPPGDAGGRTGTRAPSGDGSLAPALSAVSPPGSLPSRTPILSSHR